MSLIGHNMTRTKITNKSLILQSLLRFGSISRQQISELTQLTPATITNLSRELIEEGLLRELGDMEQAQKRVGRKSISLDLNDDMYWVLAIFVHKTKIDFGLVNLKGKVMQRKEVTIKPKLDQTKFLDLLEHEIRAYIEKYNNEHICAIGISTMGRVNFEQGILLHEETLQWHNVPVVDTLMNKFNLPVYMDNDARAMTLGEQLYGKSKLESDFLYVFIGDEGIGSGLVLANQIYRGGTSGASQFGHMTYLPDGEPCWCGNKGCVELYASIPALLKELKMDETEFLTSMSAKEPETMTALSNAGERIGIALTSFINFIYVEKIIISSIIADEEYPFIHKVRETISQRSFIAKHNQIDIVSSSIKQDVGLIGAASLALLHEIFQKS